MAANLNIIILNYNSSKDTVELFNSIAAQGNFKNLLVVDNNSELGDKEILIKNISPDSILWNKENSGYAEGNISGINYLKPKNDDLILFLNPDIRISISTIGNLCSIINKSEDLGIIGPRICYRNRPSVIYSDGGRVINEKAFHTFHLHHKMNISDVENPALHEVDYVNGSCFLFKASLLKKIGPMLTNFFLYFEETEWCLRARKNGFKCMIDSNSVAYHSSSSKNRMYHYYMMRNRIYLAKSQDEAIWPTYHFLLKKNLKLWLKSLKRFKTPDAVIRIRTKAIFDSLFRS